MRGGSLAGLHDTFQWRGENYLLKVRCEDDQPSLLLLLLLLTLTLTLHSAPGQLTL